MTLTDLNTLKKHLQFLLAQGEVGEAIELLKASLPNSPDKLLEVSYIEIRFGTLRKEILKATLSYEQTAASLNKINADILDLISNLKLDDFINAVESIEKKTSAPSKFKFLVSKNIKSVIFTITITVIITSFALIVSWLIEKNDGESSLQPLLSIFIFDKSYSSQYINLDENELVKYCAKDNKRPSRQFSVIFVRESSAGQSPYVSDKIVSPRHPTMGELDEYHKTLEMSSSQIVNLSKSNQHEEFSDVNGALQLAKQLCSQSNYSDYEIRILAFSDMLQSGADAHKLGVEPDAITFPKNVKIFLIGAKIKTPSNVFPNNTVSELVLFKADFII